jgi:hypothetical protein
MKTNIKLILFVFLASAFSLSSCTKEEYSFGELITPSGLTVATSIAGVDDANPAGNGTGSVTITTSASKAITYKVDFGDGKSQIVPSGVITYKYTNPGTSDYTVTVSAIGTGGVSSVLSKKITVFVAFEIPTYIVDALTGAGSKIWITDKEAVGHFGVSPTDAFSPIWYAAGPNSRAPEAYDDEITFSKGANNSISINVDNKGLTFMTGAATAFYGFSGPDGNYALNTGGTKKLSFLGATSSSTEENSTRVQFVVPGNGIVNFGTGGTSYEILSISETSLHIRNIGADGNAWYQKFIPKN